MIGKKQKLFAYPETHMSKFDDIYEVISRQPMIKDADKLTIEAACSYDQHSVRLAVHSYILQRGQEDSPVVIFLPWYGGKSSHARRFLDSRRHPDWTYVAIDIFNSKEDFGHIIASAVVSQYAYALVMRMMAEQVHQAHKASRRVGIMGISYGANVLSAYITRGLELPDAIVAVEGGSILQITLQVKYQGHDTDPRMLEALKQAPDLIPMQTPVAGKAVPISAAVINLEDKIVIGQDELWKNASEKMYIRGTHLTGPLLNRRKILRFADNHLETLLMPPNSQ